MTLKAIFERSVIAAVDDVCGLNGNGSVASLHDAQEVYSRFAKTNDSQLDMLSKDPNVSMCESDPSERTDDALRRRYDALFRTNAISRTRYELESLLLNPIRDTERIVERMKRLKSYIETNTPTSGGEAVSAQSGPSNTALSGGVDNGENEVEERELWAPKSRAAFQEEVRARTKPSSKLLEKLKRFGK